MTTMTMKTTGDREDRKHETKEDAGSAGSVKELEGLRAELEAAKKEAAENYDKYLRAMADLENFKKRAAREKSEAIAYGNEVLIRDVLPIIDSLDRATDLACKSADLEAFKEGFKLVKEQLLCCLGKHGVEKIEAVGTDFDPHLHDALMHVESEEHADSKVVEEFEKGYLLKGRLLKPAKVSVGKASRKKDVYSAER